MNHPKKLFVLWLVTVVSAAAIGAGFSLMRSAQAQQAESLRKDKWEYCAITWADYQRDSFGRFVGFAHINYFEVGGNREEKLEVKLEKKATNNYRFGAEQEVTALAMAKLGNEGWELIATPVTGEKTDHVTYVFKRPKL